MDNATIFFDIDYDIEPEYEKIKLDFKTLELTDTPMKLTFSVHRKLKFLIYFERRFDRDEFNSWKTKRMTGMRVKWKYNNEYKEKQMFEDYNKNFIRLTNLLVAVNSEILWENIKAAKVEWYIKREDSSSYSSGKILGLGKYFVLLPMTTFPCFMLCLRHI